jgi:tetratricopeptide (TPR) repeat protein
MNGSVVNDLVSWERSTPCFGFASTVEGVRSPELSELSELLVKGLYADALRSSRAVAGLLFDAIRPEITQDNQTSLTVREILRQRVFEIGSQSVDVCIAVELIGIAALQLFLQLNYTGPTISDEILEDVNPHPCFRDLLHVRQNPDLRNEAKERPQPQRTLQNSVLSELSVDGEWPCQVCKGPYFLLIARTLLTALAHPTRPDWTFSMTTESVDENLVPPILFQQHASQLQGVHWWNARAALAHHRLVSSRHFRHSTTLWKEVQTTFGTCIELYANGESASSIEAATILLEWGLAQFHFSRSVATSDGSKASFQKALEQTGLSVKVSGAMGKRTKFQQEAKAQMIVHAQSKAAETSSEASEVETDVIKSQMIEHSEDGILLERIKFDEEHDNEIHNLTILDQSILLALCLDVKNNNPADGLTGEEMGAYLARVLDHHDDWMVYSTALLERAWLEFERNHARERAILQLQALVDQHTDRLTLTQSTRESIESSAPVQERLINLHLIVYPPRWAMIQDLAARYEGLGIVSSAAELYLEIEEWDSVVDCYRRAGRIAHAEQLVRERLEIQETPRMWAALGDLTKDPAYYEKAIELSNGRYSNAFLALGEYFFGKGELATASEHYEKALKLRPLNATAWFRLGAISMQLGRWPSALRSFSEVVLQNPEEGEAWANIAAVHMHNKSPAEAYPALNEALRYQRSNWRIWVSKLYTCLDLEKYDEAIQACDTLLDLRAQRRASDQIPMLEEKCVRAIVGGALKKHQAAVATKDEATIGSARRTLSRVHALLDRLNATSETDALPWLLETTAFFHEQTGQDAAKVLETLTQEYRALQTNVLWEKDDALVRKVCQVVSHMVHIYKQRHTKEGLVQARFVLRGVIQKIKTARPDDVPLEVQRLEDLLSEVDNLSKA